MGEYEHLNGSEGDRHPRPRRRPCEEYLTICCCCTPVRRRYFIKRCEWVFAVLSLVDIVVSGYFTIKDMTQFPGLPGSQKDSDDILLQWVITSRTVMCGIYTLHGILFVARLSEFIAYAVCLVELLAYSIVSYNYQKNDPEDLGRLIAVVILAIACAIAGFCAVCKHRSWMWFVYFTSAKGSDRSMLHTYFLCQSLVIADLQYQVNLLTFAADSRFRTNWTEIGALIAACIGIPVWVVCGLYGMYYESKRAVAVFFLCSPGLLVYGVFRLVDVYLKSPHHRYKVATSICVVVGLLLTVATLALMTMVWRNFGKGVKEMVHEVPVDEGTSSTPADETPLTSSMGTAVGTAV